jgi:hypothetical protein
VTVVPVDTALGDLVHDAVRRHTGGAPTSVVVIAMSKDDNPKATVLAFPRHSRTPAVVVKVAMTVGAGAAVEREAEALRRLEQVDPGMVDGTVPSLLEVRHEGDHVLMVSTAKPGVPFSTDYHRWHHTSSARRVSRDFAAAGAWLDRLAGRAELACPAMMWAEGLRDRWPGDPVATHVADLVPGLQQGLETDRGTVLHGDYWCGNLMRDADRVSGVVDWEHAVFGGDRLRDRVRFVLGYTLYLDRHCRPGARVPGHPGLRAGSWGEPLRHVVSSRSWYTELVAGFIGDGLASTGRSADLWRAAFVLGVVEAAVLGDQPEFARQHLLLAEDLAGLQVGS